MLKGALMSVVTGVFIAGLLFLHGPALMQYVSLKRAQYIGRVYAVHTITGAIFYGTLGPVTRDTILLRDAYTFETVVVGETSTSNLRARADDPLTSPGGWVLLERSQVLFMEEVGADAKIRTLMPDA